RYARPPARSAPAPSSRSVPATAVHAPIASLRAPCLLLSPKSYTVSLDILQRKGMVVNVALRRKAIKWRGAKTMFANFPRLAGRPLAAIAASAMLAFAGGALLAPTLPALSADNTTAADPVYKDIEQTFGSLPTFARQVPLAALRGAWQEVKELELSDKTA